MFGVCTFYKHHTLFKLPEPLIDYQNEMHFLSIYKWTNPTLVWKPVPVALLCIYPSVAPDIDLYALPVGS